MARAFLDLYRRRADAFPRERLLHALYEAAGIEHNLMCTYLDCTSIWSNRVKHRVNKAVLGLCLGTVLIFGAHAFGAETIAASSIPTADLMQPASLAATLRSGSAARPLVLQVGFRKLFDEAHIIGAEYAGPGGSSAGIALLRNRVANLSKDTAIVIYCGCCPWDHCPNIGAAFAELRMLGLRNVKALYIAHDFGTDWIDKGYPVAKGG